MLPSVNPQDAAYYRLRLRAMDNLSAVRARSDSALFAEYVELEKRIGHRFRVELSLVEVQQAVEAGEQAGADDGAWNM